MFYRFPGQYVWAHKSGMLQHWQTILCCCNTLVVSAKMAIGALFALVATAAFALVWYPVLVVSADTVGLVAGAL